MIAFAVTLVFGLGLLGGSNVPAGMQIWRSIDSVSHGWAWDFINWEINNIGSKLHSQLAEPLRTMTPDEQAELVRDYMARARELARLESEIDLMYAQRALDSAPVTSAAPNAGDAADRRLVEAQLLVLREQQAQVQPAVEQAIERQVAGALAEHQIGALLPSFPPVWFTFTEPPRKLVASPRARIETAYYAMLQPGLPADSREHIESSIQQEYNLSAYITQIGGLGAFPAIVSDQAPLQWVLSTVAHEWVHNYLTLFPLGINYNTSPELTILNETVAEIAGDELGAAALSAAYPELVRPHAGKDEPPPERVADHAPPPFNFRREMRHTREVVDLFLEAGRVADAEQYMQIRRLLFEENGYYIRKLNQAYFAFHGAYATGAAATSPIGPKLERLRAQMPDLRTFLETVRWFTSEADLDSALEQWPAF